MSVDTARASGTKAPAAPVAVWAFLLPFLGDLAIGLGFVGFPMAGLKLGATAWQLGLLGCAPQTAFVATCLATGSASDRWGRRRIMRLGMALYVAAYATAWQVERLARLADAASASPAGGIRPLWVLMAGALLVGAAGGLFWPALEGAVADAFGHGPLGRGLLLFNLGWTIGMVAGAAAGGALADCGTYVPFAVQTCLAAVTLGLVSLMPAHPAAHSEDVVASPKPAAPPALADRFLLFARIANFCAFFGIASIRALFAPLATSLHFTGSLIGALIAMVSVAQAVSYVPLACSHRWHYRALPLFAAQAVAVGALLLTCRVSSAWLFAGCFAALGAGCGVTYTSSLFYSLNRPASRGKMGALHEAILGSGAMAGPLLGGALAEATNFRAPYLLAALVLAAGLAAQAALHWRAHEVTRDR